MGDQKTLSYDKSNKPFYSSSSSPCSFTAIVVFLIFVSYLLYSFSFISFLNPYSPSKSPNSLLVPVIRLGSGQTPEEQTELKHIVFGIAASSDLWKHRREYVKTWWKPNGVMNGAVWLDKPINDTVSSSSALPQIRISSDTSSFKYRYRNGHRSAIRITRIVSETVRMLNGTEAERNVRWVVMGDDDTVFFTENLVRVLRKYDHKQFYYIGAPSESHLQNLHQFSYGMAYGGGGFAISYPLAKVLEKMQDRCIERYSDLYGSDDRIHACMAELGVPLTKEVGFHQFDVYGNLLGLLSVHPQAPIVSIHHLDVVDPIFPKTNRVNALKKLMIPAKLDSASLVQQSVCYDKSHQWTMSISWGYTVQITRTYMPARMMEVPTRTFNDWHLRSDFTNLAFNTRPVTWTDCQRPRVFYFSHAFSNSSSSDTTTISQYLRHDEWYPKCEWGIADPSEINQIFVYKKPTPDRWSKVVIRFVPSKDSNFAFVNAIEVISAPKDLIGDVATSVSHDGTEKFNGLAKQAMEVVYRVNVGGRKVTPFNDTLWRTWVTDEGFLKTGDGSSEKSYFTGRIKYRRGGASREVGPDNVYNTARVGKRSNGLVDMSWGFKVNVGYKYLIRMHFCDIASKSLGRLYFNVYINGNLAYEDFDISYAADNVLASPYYIDFVVDATADDNNPSGSSITVSVGPSNKTSVDGNGVDAILNGVEIMKMNNSMGSLDGYVSTEMILSTCPNRRNLSIFIAMLAFMCIFMSFYIVTQRKRVKDQYGWTKLSMDVLEDNSKSGNQFTARKA
ncbi:AT4g00300 [Arabidopsis thaliana]|uniref:AT4g00300 protein n=3 Tax=Arabidopsis TaxID=3701 RepID=O23072_ARATH|nr:contains weak similarity to S. cerevisiae BOB1 protein (PIR:S45444) [Arabidopsis thaliana]AAF02793.1 contains weak similarity to S. cerevisiae BOB1 protein (PIR:S45444) [Arabidopsis thaliana]KAG7619108.1 hypothetical protein ISN44_As04g000410 [Arabidopsis suecica]CAB80788.1 AT4g00300 [Arabidopsis thaliana]